MDTLYTVWDSITRYKTESVHFLGLMNSATKGIVTGAGSRGGVCSSRGSELCGSVFRVLLSETVGEHEP